MSVRTNSSAFVDLWADGAEPAVIGVEPGSSLLQGAAKEVAARRRREAMERLELAERDSERTRGRSGVIRRGKITGWLFTTRRPRR
jgi:hypothetical protein